MCPLTPGTPLHSLQWGPHSLLQVTTAEVGGEAITETGVGATWLRSHSVSWALLPGSRQGPQVFKQKLVHKHLQQHASQ